MENKQISVETSFGTLIAKDMTDSENPGICIILKRKDGYETSGIVFEDSAPTLKDNENHDEKRHLRLLAWNKEGKEDVGTILEMPSDIDSCF